MHGHYQLCVSLLVQSYLPPPLLPSVDVTKPTELIPFLIKDLLQNQKVKITNINVASS